MPKATGSQSRPALRRNQACQTCRRRKLKCDAARPHCGTCVKQWQATISVPAPVGFAHSTEPQCYYDTVEGLIMAPLPSDPSPSEKIRQLEEKIRSLKKKLREKDANARPTTPIESGTSTSVPPQNPSSQEVPEPLIGLTIRDLDRMSGVHRDSSSPDLPIQDPLTQLLLNGWNLDLPDPETLNHYVEVFFRCDPCGPKIFHRPSFLAAMRLSPKDPNFPHSSVLHAICASAARWAPKNVTVLPDGTRRDPFVEYHTNKTRHYIDRCMSTGENIFSVMQACILLSWFFYQEGRWVEVWIFAAFQTRISIPLRLNYPGTFSTHNNDSPGAYLAPPKGFHDLESRRRTWWMTIMFDRIASVGGWLHSVDERDIGTELPLRNEDFESEKIIASNPQDISMPDVFVRHPPQYTDSFVLLIKAVMLFGKVTDFNVRGSLRAPTSPSKNQNPFFLEGFEALDKLIAHDFLESLPHIFKNINSVMDVPDGGYIDTDLYLVHIIPHAAVITLHNPYVNMNDPNNVSAARCIHAARCILAAYYMVTSTSLDITRLHPLVVICWYLAAVVQTQLCKYFIEIGDSEREATVWGEINVLRIALLVYGEKSTIGTRQEGLLQVLMKEIANMTSNKIPFEVGAPLYPFSSSTLWRKDNSNTPEDDTTGLPNPLPSNFIQHDWYSVQNSM